MKRIALLMSLLCCACFMASPALAQGPRRTFSVDKTLKRSLRIKMAENTQCQGPDHIYFGNQTFERKSVSSKQATPSPCLAIYTVAPSSDGDTADWAMYTVFYSQLIQSPKEETVLDTLRTVLPEYINENLTEKQNSNDIVFAYKFTGTQANQDLLRYSLFRAFRQSDQSIRIYRFEMTVPANIRISDEMSAYDYFNTLVNKNRSFWFESMRTLVAHPRAYVQSLL